MMDFEDRDRGQFDDENTNLQDTLSGTLPGSQASPAAARILVPDANGVVTLPAGATLEDVRAQGRDLIVELSDGSRFVIPDGAITVPQLVVDGVAIPPLNLAALLVENEPEPAAGANQSSGGNFEVDPGAIQAAYDLGDTLPYTELQFPEPEEEEIIPFEPDEEPEVVIETPDNPIGVVNAIATVDEEGLPARSDEPEGTADETNVETTTGTIVIDAPDGLRSVSLNGVEVTSVGQTFVTDLGTLTITSIDLASGEIGFSYTLQDNTLGEDTTDPFAVSVIDTDGDVANATLNVVIIDDQPIARVDTDTVEGGTFGPIDGNVLDNDESGADDYPVGEGGLEAVTGFSNESGSAAPGASLQGEYGVLTLNADGTYTYLRDPNTPGGVEDVFEYTIVDQDGSTATTTLTITIEDAPNEITFVPEVGEGTQVDEDGLPTRDDEPEGTEEGADGDGENDSDAGEATTGTITFNSPDGVDSVTINGVAITPGNLPQTIVDDETGTLVVTGFTYDPATGDGSITYTYTLADNTAGDDTSVTFDIVVTDLDGDTAEAPLTIEIIDDVPQARDDGATQATENADVTIDVFANDTTGADDVALDAIAVVEGSLTGEGELTYNGDGTFTYSPADGEEGNEDGEITFEYTITDGDGDVSTATATITLLPDSTPELVIEGGTSVNEDGLPPREGEPAGSNEDSDSETTSGTITPTTGGDDLDCLIINGVDVTNGGTVTTDRGELVVTANDDGTYSYEYTLTDNTLTDPDSETFTVVLKDSDGDETSADLVIDILDDAPDAVDDANSIAAGEYGPAEGNVIDNDIPGADGVVVTEFTGSGGSGDAGDTIQGTYGTLTINPDGTYTYVRDPGTPGGVTDIFTYTIEDGDGDTAMADLVITIADAPTELDVPEPDPDRNPALSDPGTIVDEAGLDGPPNGAAPGTDAAGDGELTSGTITYTAPDGPATVTIGGVTITAVGQTVTGAFGTLTVTSIEEGAIGYTYELTTNTNGDDTQDTFPVTVTDQDGDVSSSDLDILIIDDTPIAVADTDMVAEDTMLTASGNVITDAEANGDGGADTTGADDAAVSFYSFGGTGTAAGSPLDGNYGTLTLNADGEYTYVLDNTNPFVQGLDGSETLTEEYTYQLTDGDGDSVTTTLTITIKGNDDPVVINGLGLNAPEVILDEDDLADGSDTTPESTTQTGSFTVDSPDGLVTLTVGGVTVFDAANPVTFPVTIDDPTYGLLTITGVTPVTDANGDVVSATIDYSYTLDDNSLRHDMADQDSFTDSFEVVATDTDGSTDTASLDIQIVDDVPDAEDDTADQLAENQAIVIDALDNDVFGADGVDTSDPTKVFVSTQATQGTVTYDPDTGLFTYTPDAGAGSDEQLTDSFVYTIIDADGDVSTATVTVNLEPDSEPTAQDSFASLDDDGLPGGNPFSTIEDGDANIGDDPADASEATFTGTIDFDVGNDGPGTIAFAASADGQVATIGQENVTFNVVGNVLTATITTSPDASRIGTDLFQVEILDTETGLYQVTLLTNVLHNPGDDEFWTLPMSTVISFTVTDSDGDVLTGDGFNFVAPSLYIDFNDDAPTAYDNTGNVTEGASVAGNVLTDPDGSNNTDLAGADGYATSGAISGVVSSNVSTNTATTDINGNLVIEGEFGTLTLNPNTGAYSYDSNANATNADAQEVFAYTIVDADGDESTALLTIDIANVVGVVEDNDVLVNEAGLPDGSSPGDGSQIDANGQITVTGATGTLTYTLLSPADGTYGNLTLDSSTGEYTYVLDTAFTDGDTAENTTNTVETAESFNYEVRDSLGNLIGTGTIDVDIIDDVPTATDQASITVAEDAVGTIGGNVTTDGTPDTDGADGATVTSFTVDGVTTDVPQDGSDATYSNANGTYTMDMDGNWTFDPNPGLNQKEGPVDAGFTYTLTDGDDDFDTAEQPILIEDGAAPTAGPDITLEVDDEHLADGSDPASEDFDSDTIVFTEGSDPITSIVFGDTSGLDGGLTWTRVSDTEIVGSDGTRDVVRLDLSVAGTTATVTATLLDNYDDHPGINADDLAALGTVDVVATDLDMDMVSSTVTVGVSDDLPTVDANPVVRLDDDAVTGANGNPGGTGNDIDSEFATGTLAFDFNADENGSIALLDTGAPAGFTYSLNGTNLEVFQGATKVLTITVDATTGDYTVTQNAPILHADGADENNVEFNIGYRVTDGDGDFIDGSLTVNVDDDTPTALGGSSTGTVDEEGLADGIEGGDGDVVGTADVAMGSIAGLFSGGADSPLTYGFTGDVTDVALLDNGGNPVTSGGDPVTYSISGNVLTASAGGSTVFTLTINTTNGDWTFDLEGVLDHPVNSTEDDLVLEFGDLVQATDADNDSVTSTGSLAITVDDDTPVVTSNGTEDSATVDETNLNVTDTADFGTAFDIAHGADGELSTVFTLAVTSSTSNLVDTLTGTPVTLAVESSDVVGRNGSGQEVFRMSVDSDGVVTLDQSRAVEHADPAQDNEPISLTDGLVTLTATATDGDNDVDDATINIGANMVFLDDAPTNLVVSANSSAQVDESAGFPVSDVSDAALVSFSVDYGNDGAGDVAYSIDVVGGGASGLFTAQGEFAITLVETSDTLITGIYNDGVSDQTAFTISIDPNTGLVTLTQNVPLEHADPTDHNDSLDLFGFVQATVTVTDGDDDPISESVEIGGALTFLDDGPEAFDGVNSLTEDTPSVGGNILTDGADPDSYGNDGAGEISSISGDGGAGTVGGTTTGEWGTLELNADGTYTYTLNTSAVQFLDDGVNETDTFTYEIIDADGDKATATLTITILGQNDAPEAANDTNWVLDVTTGPDPEITGDVLADVPHNGAPDGAPRADVEDTDVDATDTLTVTAISGGTVGTGFTTTYGTLTVNADGSYSYVLDANNPVVDALDDGETVVETFTYTVSDGTATDTATLEITIFGTNDAPVANADTNWTIEDASAAITGQVIVGEAHPGAPSGTFADVADTDVDVETLTVSAITGSGGAGTVGGITDGTYGNLTLNADGSYSYDLDATGPGYDAVQALGDGETLTDTFTYTVTDGDESVSTTLTITIFGQNDAPLVGTATAAVSDEGLTDGNPDATGNPTDTTDSASDSGSISITDVDDSTFTVTLSEPIGSYTSGGLPITWSGDGTGTLTGSTTAGTVIVVTIDDAGNWTVDQQAQIDHPDTTSEDVLSLTVPITVNDGTVDVGSTLTISLEDDSPVAFTPVDLSDTDGSTAATNDDAMVNDGTQSETRLLNDADNDGTGADFIGGDGFGSLTFTNGTDGQALTDTGGVALTSGGDPIYLFGFGTDTVTATTSADNSDPGAVVFTATLDEGTGAGDDATYTITYSQTIDDGSGFVFDDFSDAPAGQNQWIGLDADGGDIDLSQNDSEDLLISALNGGTVNTSSTDIGSNNQWIDENEGIRLDFVVDVAGSGNESVTNGFSFDSHFAVTNSSFSVLQLRGGGPGADITIELFNDTGTGAPLGGSQVAIDVSSIVVTDSGGNDVTGSVTITDNGDGTATVEGLLLGYNVYFEAIGDAEFSAVEISHAGTGQDFALGAFGFSSAVSGNDINMSLDVLATDADGDSVEGSIDFSLVPNAVTPVVLDITGNGIQYVGLDQGLAYDYDGDGVKTQTAWVAAGAAILAFDADNNNTVTDASEFVFGGNGLTDLQALAANYDDNGDGVLDAQDSGFAQFGIWQDHDGDAVADPGEFVTLEDAGIVSIQLVSDGETRSEAGGDVTVFGEASFTWADGSTGTVADASFLIGNDVDQDAMDALLASSTQDLPDEKVALEGQSSDGQGTQDLDPVRVAIDEIDGNGQVDAILDGLLGSAEITSGGSITELFNPLGDVAVFTQDPISAIDLGNLQDDAAAMASAQSG